ncbi:hypothetical protein [Actinokineospora fastidiosa]|nr:hypothetical protein [Actinokineospora fastidiosa]
MKLIAVVVMALGLIAAPRTAVAAGCAWTVTELPAPAGYSHASTTAHAGAGLVVGTVWKTDHREGVVWRDGVPRVLPTPPGKGAGSNYPAAVNASGVIAGRWAGNDGSHTAWRYADGVYQFLPGRGSWVSVPTDINRAGDVAGFSRLFFGGAQVNTLRWPVDAPGGYVDLGEASPRGIDDAGRVVLSTGRVVNADGTSWQLQGGLPSAYEDGRIVGYQGAASPYTIVEWDLTGRIVRRVPDGIPTGMNAAGAIVGVHTAGTVAVWHNGGVEHVTSPAPARSHVLDITDDNAIVSDYRVSSATRSGLWRCV